jgi:hypothetical protein
MVQRRRAGQARGDEGGIGIPGIAGGVSRKDQGRQAIQARIWQAVTVLEPPSRP